MDTKDGYKPGDMEEASGERTLGASDAPLVWIDCEVREEKIGMQISVPSPLPISYSRIERTTRHVVLQPAVTLVDSL
jgi:hypothetical protein